MYNNFIDKYSDLKRAYVNLMKDSKRIYDEISSKLAKAIIKINRLESENKELKRNLEELCKEKCSLCETNLKYMNGWRLEK